MGLNVGNLPVTAVHVGSTPVKAVYVGAQKVWPVGPRTVTIKSTGSSFEISSTGDASLIDGWPRNGSEQGVAFAAPVTCDEDVRNVKGYFTTGISAGGTIPAGTTVLPGYGTAGEPHVFTEVL